MNINTPNLLTQLAKELAEAFSSDNSASKLISAVRKGIDCDAIVLLLHEDGLLKPIAQQGLTKDVLGRRFEIDSHPRFEEICNSESAVIFAEDYPQPDPYDGMMLGLKGDLHVHACMGFPLISENTLLGALTLDSLDSDAFRDISPTIWDIISSVAVAVVKNITMLQHFEESKHHSLELMVELTSEVFEKEGGEIIGESEPIKKLKQDILLVAPSDYSILIEGETGVGKELVAREIHSNSIRSKQPLVYVNCAALPENLIESELFGHVKGAFTGADRHRAGKFSLADGGTIFLDEIGELPLSVQGTMLRVLQTQEIQPVGLDKTEHVNVRVLTATNRVLETEVKEGRFRADLYHRLSVFPIKVPPLRDRTGDIPLLSGYFTEIARRKLGIQQLLIEPKVMWKFERYDWPGNVRELEHVISRAALRAKSDGAKTGEITKVLDNHIEHLNDQYPHSISVDEDVEEQTLYNLKQETDNFQRKLISQVLEQENGNWSSTAKRLNVDRANLNRLAKRLGIKVKKNIEVVRH